MALRILLLAAGNSIHTRRWAVAFAQRGHEVHLATQHPPEVAVAHGVTVHVLPFRGAKGYALNGRALHRLVSDLAPDVVNAHYASGYGSLARWCSGIPLVLNVWGSDVFDFPLKSFLHKWLIRSNMRRAAHVVSTSEVMASRTNAICPGSAHVHVVPFGVDCALFRPNENDAQRKELVIGTVKTLAPKYGVDTLIEAYALLRRGIGDSASTRLRIVGDGPQRSALEDQVRKLGITDTVEFIGAVPHEAVPSALHQLDVFCALSRDDSESFGVAVVEASACGLPVVVSDAGGLPEVVHDAVTGWVVPRNNAQAAAAKLSELVVDAAQRQRMGAAGRQRVLQRYEWNTCVDEQVGILERAAGKR